MTLRRILPVMLAALLAFAALPARATDTHQYAKGEYAIIRDGLSPDRKVSLSSHGDGEGGDENFHVWLMAEPAHRRIMPLADIAARLDTGPDAYRTTWSPDSRRFAVSFRTDRHEAQLNIYNIVDRRAHLVLGPSLFRDVTGRDIGAQDQVRSTYAELEWRGPRRFLLREHHLLVPSAPGFAGRLGAYGKEAGKSGDSGMFVEFAAEADCVLLPGNRYRIVDLRPGKFGQ